MSSWKVEGKLETSYEEVEGVCGGSAAKGVFGVQVAYKEVMESASLTQSMGSNIPTVFSWGSSKGPEGFLASIMLLVVINVVVVIVVVTVILVVVVVEGSSIIKLSFVIIDSLYRIVPCYLIH
ncbi:hypothetical protein Tco_0138993 [Tanacetum coccineum]